MTPHSRMWIYIRTSSCVLNIDTNSIVDYISVKLEKMYRKKKKTCCKVIGPTSALVTRVPSEHQEMIFTWIQVFGVSHICRVPSYRLRKVSETYWDVALLTRSLYFVESAEWLLVKYKQNRGTQRKLISVQADPSATHSDTIFQVADK